MWRKLLFVFFAGVIVSGCASSIREEVSQLEGRLAKSKADLSSTELWLRENRDVYNGSSCITPARGMMPKFSCQTVDEAKQKSLAACAISYKGCDIALSSYKEKLDSEAKKFLASEACEQMLAEIQGEERRIGDTIIDGFGAVTKNLCDSDNIVVKFLGCTYYAATEITKFANFLDCTSKKRSQCLSNYSNWREGPEKKKAECDSKLSDITTYKRNISDFSEKIREKKNSFAWMLFGR